MLLMLRQSLEEFGLLTRHHVPRLSQPWTACRDRKPKGIRTMQSLAVFM